jgi:hypothetical protein
MSTSPTLIPAPARHDEALPGWLAPALLAGLIAVGGVIALVGWLAMSPDQRAVGDAELAARTEAAPAVETPAPASEQTPVPTPEPNAIVEPAPRDEIVLQRRMPVGDAPGPNAVASIDRQGDPEPAPPKLKTPAPEEKKPALIAPLQWTLEPADSRGMYLIMPIEIAKVENTSIPYTVRRLKLSGDAPRQLRLAVTPVMHDDLGSVLTSMGDGYRFAQLRKEDVFNYDMLRKYDVVFLTCADLYAQDFQAAGPLRKFVMNGGTLYASDLRGDLLQAAFPEYRSLAPVLPGVPQNVEASVVEPGLRSYLGRRSIPLQFEAPDWRPPPFDPAKVTVCLRGTYRNNRGDALIMPLLVKFNMQKGTVIFTSFHHTKNDSAVVRKLLDYLVFASVSARSEARVRELMQRSKFSAHELRPVVLNSADAIEGTYEHTAGGLQIACGFENLGARVKVTLRSPGGQVIEHAEEGLYLIEVPKAEPGVWRYTVTPLELPYGNFPIIVAVGGGRP